MPEMSCKHANQFFTQKTNEIAYKNIINHLAFPKSKREFTHKASLYCTLCKTRGEDFDVCNKDLIRPRCLLACAHCIHFACWDYRHIYLHREDHPDHYLSVCTERGELFCTGCGDFVYHSVAESFHQSACRTYLAQFGLSNRYWRPSFNELRLIPHITPVLPLTVNGCSGAMRGLINMGNTCFLNVVIQALTHTPVLRDYLLADLHRCSSPTRSRNCLACEMVRITQELYKPVVTPFVPNNLLYAIWLHASHLAGYEQRDAHEFLITLLTLIHGHLVGEESPHDHEENCTLTGQKLINDQQSRSSNPNRNFINTNHNLLHHHQHNSKVIRETPKIINSTECIPQPDSNSQASSVSSSRESSDSCDCIVHQVFFGDLESVISYEGCEHRSSTVDPFLDLSLDVIQRGSTSLQACLGSYFRPELIDGLIWCSQCNIGRPAVKQFSLLHLPNVLCFYLKRCHHDTKINTSITFPVELDMAPYLHQIVGDQSAWYDKYSLYAVLNHSGQTNSGHYTAYIRVGPGAWCLCDDQKVVSVNLNDVLHTDAYVLLYHKNLLAVRI
ncbi:unnamed protein product [Schistosoma haematobium]|nr:unnamed protein product [Schistosoma haematobium]CAH8621134.1 unnamed protein product [Schistosoma haematobium]